MTNEEIQELCEMKQDNLQEMGMYRNYTVFFDKFMDLFGDNLIEMKKFCNKYDWSFAATLDTALQEI